jgi:serine/threonine protein kinase
LQHFARKLISVFGQVTKEDIENELRAYEDFLKHTNHPNIIKVFNRGWYIVQRPFHFIDMELCDLDLHDYIHEPGSRSLVDGTNDVNATNDCKFVTADAALLSKAQNIWSIATDIANGLDAIHSHTLVHRDLKPRNSKCFS